MRFLSHLSLNIGCHVAAVESLAEALRPAGAERTKK
jgi:hypothetical protein